MASARDRAPAVGRPVEYVFAVLRVVAGVFAVLAGWAMMVWPGRSLVVLPMIVGVALVVTAAVGLWTAVTAPQGRASSRFVGVVGGLLLLAAAAVFLSQPVLTMTTFTVVLGVAWLVGGVVEIHRALTSVDDRLASAVGGPVNLLVGVVALGFPQASALGIVWVVGAGLVVVGVVAVVHGLRSPLGRPTTPSG